MNEMDLRIKKLKRAIQDHADAISGEYEDITDEHVIFALERQDGTPVNFSADDAESEQPERLAEIIGELDENSLTYHKCQLKDFDPPI